MGNAAEKTGDRISAPRSILRQLHDVMASRSGAQGKLNRVVQIIASALASEVCSIYLLREGKMELFATEGLLQSAVHLTRLEPDEGLVGTIATTRRLLNLAEAGDHPNFSYKPETGEDVFHSFAGVPILRKERAIGVVAVQHVEPRSYSDEEIEALQTVAMVLAEMISGSGLMEGSGSAADRSQQTSNERLQGLRLVDGLARGVAVFHTPQVEVEHTVAEDIEYERQRVIAAFATMREQIERLMGQADFGGSGEHEEILETYKLFAFDEGFARRINEAIDSGLTAEAAIQRVQQRMRDAMEGSKNPFFVERLHDLDDLSNRLLRIVTGKMGTAAQTGAGHQELILLAKGLGPAELLEYDRRTLKGVVLEEGSPTAHVVILARAMGVPMLGRVKNLTARVEEGDPLLIDAANEALYVRPSESVVSQYQASVAMRAKRQAEYAEVRHLPSVTTDDVPINLLMNAGLRVDLPGLELTNAEGIGLFRTEFQFLVSAALPRRGAQTQLYREVLAAAGDKPVTFRSVDIGGDKAVPYMKEELVEENPTMGWRALRLALERKGLLKVQSRALLDAAAGRELNLMFPMVSEPWEFDQAHAIVEEQRAHMASHGKAVPSRIRYGVMLEVPALAFQLEALFDRIDFLSIGTNDLVQFLLAADRSNPKLADRYDWLSPGILRFLRMVVEKADAHDKPLTVCGEMGGRPIECLALMGLGVRRFSITPAAVGPIKAMVRASHFGRLRAAMDGWLSERDVNVRQHLEAFVQEHGLPV